MTSSISYIGVTDKDIDLFEGQYRVPSGMLYNSYLIEDEKIAVIDTVDAHFADRWIDNLRSVLGNRNPDYLIVQHMEPDHSGSLTAFLSAYPNTTIVASSAAFVYMKQFFDIDRNKLHTVIANDGGKLSLGQRELSFFTAPMVHWPEVIMTYDSYDKVLFSADAFGKFGSEKSVDDWACEARRYYFGIVGKYGNQVQGILKKLASADIQTICPLHGPVLEENLGYYLNLYQTWSSYDVESDGVVIAYTSVYGNTEKAVCLLAEMLTAEGCPKVTVIDLARCDMSEAVEDAFRYGKLVLATTTYNADIFPFMREFIHHLTERNFQNRTVALIENGTWAPTAAKTMQKLLEGCKNLTFIDPIITIRSAMTDENRQSLSDLAKKCK